MLRNNADARRCSYFELGLPVVELNQSSIGFDYLIFSWEFDCVRLPNLIEPNQKKINLEFVKELTSTIPIHEVMNIWKYIHKGSNPVPAWIFFHAFFSQLQKLPM